MVNAQVGVEDVEFDTVYCRNLMIKGKGSIITLELIMIWEV